MRESILNLEDAIKAHPDHFEGDSPFAPITHHFADGVYVREMFAPKGSIIVGKIHNQETVNILLSGRIEVVAEDTGPVTLTAPCVFVSQPGIKKAGHCLTDVIFINVHQNQDNSKDLVKIEKRVVSDTYREYQKAIEPSFFKRITKLLWK